MPRAALQYVALITLFVTACLVRGGNTANLLRALKGEPAAGPPVTLTAGARTIAAGPLAGNQILALNGIPFNAGRQLALAVGRSQPGDVMRLTLSRPDGSAFEREIRIPDRAASVSSVRAMGVPIAFNVLVPIVAIGLGVAAVAIRPMDWNAWLVLFLMLGFTETVALVSYWPGAVPVPALLWHSFWDGAWPVAMLLFSIYFPTRSELDRSRPWMKYIGIAFFVTVNAVYQAVLLLWQWDINAATEVHAQFVWFSQMQIATIVLANGAYFANFHRKRATGKSADDRRRLKLLLTGSYIGLGPTGVIAVYAVLSGRTLFAGVPSLIAFPSLLLLPVFPLTLAYVIVVERAMDLRVVIRSGVQYGLAKAGLWALRAGLIAILVYVLLRARTIGGPGQYVELGVAMVGLIVLRQQRANRLSDWIDRRFFREAYDAEKVLADLAGEVSRFIEVRPLLERIAVRVSQTLHISDIVILLREGDAYRTAYSTRSGEPMDIPASSRIVANLEKRGEPLEIYFDKPPVWLRSLTAEELQTLDFMRTQLLLPLSGRSELIGVMSLGAKRSEAPYSARDITLLQAVAWQAGMAIENSRLAASLAEEAANRERINTELEIAREVQERLFPQEVPSIPGLRLAGRCRSAQGVGGDYYDFLQLPGGRLGIAVGDVSGKGVSASLLMANLQAGFRGQALAGVTDLSKLIGNVNRLVYETSAAARYVTLFYGEYDPDARELRFVNAGHNPPLLFRGSELFRLETGGPVVGLLKNAAYESGILSLCPGDILVAYTDGITEAQNVHGDEWGEERLIATIRGSADRDPDAVISEVFQAAYEFMGAAEQYDDMTLVVMKAAAGRS